MAKPRPEVLRRDPSQDEIDRMAVRCGLLPHERFLREKRPLLGEHIPPMRGNGTTTQALLAALVLAEGGEHVAILGTFAEREHAKRGLRQIAEAGNLVALLELIRFVPSSEFLRGLPPHHYRSA